MKNPLTGKVINQTGCSWFTHGAQKGVAQPPYVIRLRGRWYRTVPLSLMSEDVRREIEEMPRLDFGVRRCLDYLSRTHKRFSDLPIFPIEGKNEQKHDQHV